MTEMVLPWTAPKDCAKARKARRRAMPAARVVGWPATETIRTGLEDLAALRADARFVAAVITARGVTAWLRRV